MANTDEVRRFGRDVWLPGGPDEALRITPTGDLRSIEGRDNLHRAVRTRLLTSPGELVHRPTYGAGLELYVEQPSTPATRAEIHTRSRRSLLEDPRIEDAKVNVITGSPASASDDDAVTVSVAVRPRGDNDSDTLTLSVE